MDLDPVHTLHAELVKIFPDGEISDKPVEVPIEQHLIEIISQRGTRLALGRRISEGIEIREAVNRE